MRVTVEIDDDLLAKANSYTGLNDIPAIMNEALTELIQREERRRLAISDR